MRGQMRQDDVGQCLLSVLIQPTPTSPLPQHHLKLPSSASSCLTLATSQLRNSKDMETDNKKQEVEHFEESHTPQMEEYDRALYVLGSEEERKLVRKVSDIDRLQERGEG